MRMSTPYKVLAVLGLGFLIANIGYHGTPISRSPEGWVHFYYWLFASFLVLTIADLLLENELP